VFRQDSNVLIRPELLCSRGCCNDRAMQHQCGNNLIVASAQLSNLIPLHIQPKSIAVPGFGYHPFTIPTNPGMTQQLTVGRLVGRVGGGRCHNISDWPLFRWVHVVLDSSRRERECSKKKENHHCSLPIIVLFIGIELLLCHYHYHHPIASIKSWQEWEPQ
jgi:hypothetical protein